MAKIMLIPGNMHTATLAIDLFGVTRVDPGTWTTPVFVENVSEEEIHVAQELLKKEGITVTVEEER